MLTTAQSITIDNSTSNSGSKTTAFRIRSQNQTKGDSAYIRPFSSKENDDKLESMKIYQTSNNLTNFTIPKADDRIESPIPNIKTVRQLDRVPTAKTTEQQQPVMRFSERDASQNKIPMKLSNGIIGEISDSQYFAVEPTRTMTSYGKGPINFDRSSKKFLSPQVPPQKYPQQNYITPKIVQFNFHGIKDDPNARPSNATYGLGYYRSNRILSQQKDLNNFLAPQENPKQNFYYYNNGQRK